MTYPMRISPCTSTIETAVYVNRTHGGVRGRELVTPSYSIIFSTNNMDNSLNLIESLLNDEEYSNSSKYDQTFLEELLIFLFTFEDGYLRFDFDDIENEDEMYHPKHHIDFYYSNSNTFKLGIMDKISLKKSIEIIDINNKCLNIT